MIAYEFEGTLITLNGQNVHQEVRVGLAYDKSDPLAVEVTFHQNGESGNPWLIGRNLFCEAVESNRPVGKGDVKLTRRARSNALLMCVKSPSGHAHIILPLDQVSGFLEETQLDADIADDPTAIEAALDRFILEVLGG